MREIATIVLPVFGIIALGYVVAWRGIIPERMGEGLSAFVFTIAIPAYLFRTMLTSTLPAAIPWEYWAVYFGGLGVVSRSRGSRARPARASLQASRPCRATSC
jgi:malonate transporter and related proteins